MTHPIVQLNTLVTPLLNYEKVLRNALLLRRPLLHMFRFQIRPFGRFCTLFFFFLVISSNPALAVVQQLRSLSKTGIKPSKRITLYIAPEISNPTEHHETGGLG